MFTNPKIYSQQGRGFPADPRDQAFQRAPGVPQVQFSQQVLLLQLLPVKDKRGLLRQRSSSRFLVSSPGPRYDSIMGSCVEESVTSDQGQWFTLPINL